MSNYKSSLFMISFIRLVPCLALQVSRQMAGPTNTTLLGEIFFHQLLSGTKRRK